MICEKLITLTKEDVDEAITEYLARKEVTFNVDKITYKVCERSNLIQAVEVKAY